MKRRMAGYTATGQSTNGSGSGCARSLSEPTSPTTVRIICGITNLPPAARRSRSDALCAAVATQESFPFSHPRTTLAGPIERLLIAPYWVNFHAEHHLFMYLPRYRLPEAHRLLIEKGLIKRMEVRPGYLDVMRLATSGQRAA